MNLSKFQETVKDREAWHSGVYRGHKESDMTGWLNTECPNCLSAAKKPTGAQTLPCSQLALFWAFYLLPSHSLKKSGWNLYRGTTSDCPQRSEKDSLLALESGHRTKSFSDLSVGYREELWGVKGGDGNQGADERDWVKLCVWKRRAFWHGEWSQRRKNLTCSKLNESGSPSFLIWKLRLMGFPLTVLQGLKEAWNEPTAFLSFTFAGFSAKKVRPPCLMVKIPWVHHKCMSVPTGETPLRSPLLYFGPL